MIDRLENARALLRPFARGAASPLSQVYPTLAAPLSVTSGASKALGAWVELIAAHTGGGMLLAWWATDAATLGYDIKMQVGVGAAGSEVVIYEVMTMIITDAGVRMPNFLPRPALIPQGARVAVRGATGFSSTVVHKYYFIISGRPLK